ncbi:Uncharacterized protein APZ42_034429 [Daphnia magna]|uniref:Uncharacterized protein n=1 Tax=Daphnia magna TaxID=35525 RepID=A0A164K529_9CRUS|nr:Uncharacterized protein APZ42_034429 [Daphnia magna]
MEQNPTVFVALKDIGSPELHISLTSVLFQRVKPAHCVRRMAHHPRHQLIILFQKHTRRRQLIHFSAILYRPLCADCKASCRTPVERDNVPNS